MKQRLTSTFSQGRNGSQIALFTESYVRRFAALLVRSTFSTLMTTMTKEATVKPEHVFRLRGISVSVFANTTKMDKRTVTFRKVSMQRSYRDDDGEWQTTTSFGRDDLPVVQLLLERAYAFILDTEANRARVGEDD